MGTKIPKLLYVVSKLENRYSCELGLVNHPLGFLHSYEPGKPAFEKKQSTQHDWAYSQNLNSSTFSVEDDVLYIHGHEFRQVPGTENSGTYQTERIQINEPVPIQPAIWVNEPLEGFKVLTTVSRYSTSNKFWRVLDPRGIQFEISTASFEKIVLNGSIVKGEILGKCIWTSNKNLALVS